MKTGYPLLIFLDFDGVLNSLGLEASLSLVLDRGSVERLNRHFSKGWPAAPDRDFLRLAVSSLVQAAYSQTGSGWIQVFKMRDWSDSGRRIAPKRDRAVLDSGRLASRSGDHSRRRA